MRRLLGDVLYALDNARVNVSRINFHCDAATAETAKVYFEKVFKKEWDATELSHCSDEEEWKEYIENTANMYYDGDEEARYPISVFSANNGFSVEISTLAVDVTDGVTYYNEPNTLFNALARFQKEYPGIPFEGYVGYMMIDEHGSDVSEFTVSSDNGIDYDLSLDTLFPSIGEGLAKALETEDFLGSIFNYIEDFGEGEEDDDDDYRFGLKATDVLKVLSSYSAWLPKDTCEKFIALLEEKGAVDCEAEDALVMTISSDDDDDNDKPAAEGPLSRANRFKDLDYTIGDRVHHVRFGEGTVIDIQWIGRDYEVTVDFEGQVKKFFATFAHLKKE